jgi:hypothetical protein
VELTATEPSRRTAYGLVLVLGAAALSLLLLAGLAVLPTTSTTTSATTGRAPITTVTRSSMLTEEGPSVLAVLGVPLALSLVALAGARWSRRRGLWLGCGIAGLGFSVLALMSIGIFCIPVALLLLAAGLTEARPAHR